MNQQETPFVRPEGMQGASPIRALSTTARVLPTAAGLLLNVASWRTPRGRAQRAGSHFSLNPSTRKTWGNPSNIPYMIRTVSCHCQAPTWPWPHPAVPTDHNFSTLKSSSTHTFLSLTLKEEGTRVGGRTGGDKTEEERMLEKSAGMRKEEMGKTTSSKISSVLQATYGRQMKSRGLLAQGDSCCVKGREAFCRLCATLLGISAQHPCFSFTLGHGHSHCRVSFLA